MYLLLLRKRASTDTEILLHILPNKLSITVLGDPLISSPTGNFFEPWASLASYAPPVKGVDKFWKANSVTPTFAKFGGVSWSVPVHLKEYHHFLACMYMRCESTRLGATDNLNSEAAISFLKGGEVT